MPPAERSEPGEQPDECGVVAVRGGGLYGADRRGGLCGARAIAA